MNARKSRWVTAYAVLAVLILASAAVSGIRQQRATNTTVVMVVTSLPGVLTSTPWAGVASHVAFTGNSSNLVDYNTAALKGGGCREVANGSHIQGRLAESIKFNKAGDKLVVVVRPLKSAAGNTLSAQDVKWSLQRDIANDAFTKSGMEDAGFNVKNIGKIINARTIELNVPRPTSYSIEILANNIELIYDSTEVLKNATPEDPWGTKWLNRNIADYSGWELESFTPGTSLIVKSVPGWGGKRGNIQRLVIRAVPDPATRQQLILSGDADIALGLQYDQYKSLAAKSGLFLNRCVGLVRDTIHLNTKAEPTNDPLVREAISLAIDRKALIRGAYAGFGSAAKTEFVAGYGVERQVKNYQYNVAKAKQLLAQAGRGGGFPLTLTYSPTRPGPVADRSAVLIQSMLADVGIKVTLKRVASSAEFNSISDKREFQALLYSNPPPLSDPAFYQGRFLGTGNPSNSSQFSNAQYDALLAKLGKTPTSDTVARKQILVAMAKIIAKENPILTLVQVTNLAVFNTRIAPAPTQVNGQFRWTHLTAKPS